MIKKVFKTRFFFEILYKIFYSFRVPAYVIWIGPVALFNRKFLHDKKFLYERDLPDQEAFTERENSRAAIARRNNNENTLYSFYVFPFRHLFYFSTSTIILFIFTIFSTNLSNLSPFFSIVSITYLSMSIFFSFFCNFYLNESEKKAIYFRISILFLIALLYDFFLQGIIETIYYLFFWALYLIASFFPFFVLYTIFYFFRSPVLTHYYLNLPDYAKDWMLDAIRSKYRKPDKASFFWLIYYHPLFSIRHNAAYFRGSRSRQVLISKKASIELFDQSKNNESKNLFKLYQWFLRGMAPLWSMAVSIIIGNIFLWDNPTGQLAVFIWVCFSITFVIIEWYLMPDDLRIAQNEIERMPSFTAEKPYVSNLLNSDNFTAVITIVILAFASIMQLTLAIPKFTLLQ